MCTSRFCWERTSVASTSQEAPDVRIIAVTRHNDGTFARRMIAAGARGYVLKQSSFGELTKAIREVAGGAEYLDARIAPLVAGPAPVERPRVDAAAAGSLTDAEEQVLRLLAEARTMREIGTQLSIGAEDVAELKAAIVRKTGLRTRIHMIGYVRDRGWM